MQKARLVLSAGVGAVTLGAVAFYSGTLYEAKFVPPHTIIQRVVVVPPGPDPEARLRLDTLCAQSAASYMQEHSMRIGDEDQERSQHGYNPKLGKCFVLLQSYVRLSDGGSMYEWLNDPADGTEYGVFVGRRSIVDEKLQEDVVSCATDEPTGKKLCGSRKEWETYVKTMMNQPE